MQCAWVEVEMVTQMQLRGETSFHLEGVLFCCFCLAVPENTSRPAVLAPGVRRNCGQHM
jgi:hypothetical protein